MELYPLIKPLVNFVKNKTYDNYSFVYKTTDDLFDFAKGKARRLLSDEVVKPSVHGAKGPSIKDEVSKETPAVGTSVATPKGKVDGAEGDAVIDTEEKSTVSYPNKLFSDDTIQHGGFMVYLFFILYAFIGIALVTQGYINPAIDIIKKKGILGSDTMNATLLAFSNSAAESFIVMNSIFFGVSDIGI